MIYLVIGFLGLLTIYYLSKNNFFKQNEISQRLDEVIQKTLQLQKATWDELSEGDVTPERKEKLYKYITVAKAGHEESVAIIKERNISITKEQRESLDDIKKNFKIILEALK